MAFVSIESSVAAATGGSRVLLAQFGFSRPSPVTGWGHQRGPAGGPGSPRHGDTEPATSSLGVTRSPAQLSHRSWVSPTPEGVRTGVTPHPVTSTSPGCPQATQHLPTCDMGCLSPPKGDKVTPKGPFPDSFSPGGFSIVTQSVPVTASTWNPPKLGGSLSPHGLTLVSPGVPVTPRCDTNLLHCSHIHQTL